MVVGEMRNFSPTTMGDADGVVVAIPQVDVLCSHLLRHLAGMPVFRREAEGEHALF